jgi:hypothetical protein
MVVGEDRQLQEAVAGKWGILDQVDGVAVSPVVVETAVVTSARILTQGRPLVGVNMETMGVTATPERLP